MARKRIDTPDETWEVTKSQAPLLDEAQAGLAAAQAFEDTAPTPAPAPPARAQAPRAAQPATPRPAPVAPRAAVSARDAAILGSLRNSHPAHVDHGGHVVADLGHRAVVACKCGEVLHPRYRDPRPGEAP